MVGLLSFFWLRLLSVLVIIALKVGLSEYYLDLFFSFTWVHYIFQLFAFGVKRQGSLTTWVPPVSFFVLSFATAVMMVFQSPPALLYFGIHFVFSEVYTLEGLPFEAFTAKSIFARLMVNSTLYLILLHSYYPVNRIPLGFLVGVCILFYLRALYVALQLRKNLLDRRILDVLGAEAVGLLVACICAYYSIEVGFSDVIFYHVVWWIFYTLSFSESSFSLPLVSGYVILVGVCLFFTPRLGFISWFSLGQWLFWTEVLSYFHISISFVISQKNPEFIRRAFGAESRTQSRSVDLPSSGLG